LTNIEENEANILPFLTIVETSFFSFINVKVKAEQVMARNAGHAPALYSGYLTGTWFN
jgi:hypothetical protein